METILKSMVGRAGIFCLVITTIAITGCGSGPTCDEPQFYESATGGKRIEAPDDLDELQSLNEMVIPEASPRPPREPGSGCLDRPPTLKIEE